LEGIDICQDEEAIEVQEQEAAEYQTEHKNVSKYHMNKKRCHYQKECLPKNRLTWKGQSSLSLPSKLMIQ